MNNDTQLIEILLPQKEPSIFIDKNSIIFSSKLSREMQLKKGDKVRLLNDLKLGDYYFQKADTGIPVKPLKEKSNRYVVHSQQMAKVLKKESEKAKFICEKKTYNNEDVFIIFTRKNYYGEK